MKKRIIVLMLTGIILSVSACSSSTGTDSSQSDNQKTEQQEDDKDKVDQSNENTADLSEADSEKKVEDTISNEDKSVEIKVYVCNDDATAFVSESVKIDELTPENIEHIVDAFAKREEVKHFAHLASYEEVSGNDYNLSVSTYVEAEDTREKIDIVKLNAEIKEIVAREQVLRDEIDKIITEIEV